MPLPTVKDPETGTVYKITPKFEAWMDYYNDPKEKDTFGNATQSAIKAYKLDPVKQYDVARRIGSSNVAKRSVVAKDYAERHGLSFNKYVGFAIKQMMETKKETWWDRVGEITDMKGAAQSQSGTTINNTQINVRVDSQKDWNSSFKSFLQSGQQK